MIKRLILALLLISVSSSVFAQRFHKQKNSYGSREGRFEAGLVVAYQNSVSKTNDGGSELNIDSRLGWGLSIGWNWTSHLNFGYRLSVLNPDYTATIVPEDTTIPTQTLNYRMTKVSHQLNATWLVLDKPFTPYVQAGAGIASLDSNVPDSPPTTGCWWDPWWGYVCNTTWSTYKKTGFAYNLGLGVRWDVNGALYFKGAYDKEWMKVDSGTISFDILSLEGGLMF